LNQSARSPSITGSVSKFPPYIPLRYIITELNSCISFSGEDWQLSQRAGIPETRKRM
jgi:hypothetical protein